MVRKTKYKPFDYVNCTLKTDVAEETKKSPVSPFDSRPQNFDYESFYSRAVFIDAKYQQQYEDLGHELARCDTDNIKESIDLIARNFSLRTLRRESEWWIPLSPVSHTSARSPAAPAPLPRATGSHTIERVFLDSCALILSRKRSGPSIKGASGQVTATVLRKSNNEYTLYVAKNAGFSEADKRLIRRIEEWMNSPNARDDCVLDNDLWRSILVHITDRIKSYLDSKTDKRFVRCQQKLEEHLATRFPDSIKDRDFYQFLYSLKTILSEIHSEKGECLKPRHSILRRAYAFVHDREDMICLFKTCLEQYELPYFVKHPILYCITLAEDLARISFAFMNLVEFRNSRVSGQAKFHICPVERTPSTSRIYKPDHAKLKKRMSREIMLSNQNSEVREEVMKKIRQVNMVVHCEMQLLSHILGDIKMGKIEIEDLYDFIGCTKRPCFLCAGTVNLGTSFKTAEPHWKLYWQWGIPEDLMTTNHLFWPVATLYLKMGMIIRDGEGMFGKKRIVPDDSWIHDPRPECSPMPIRNGKGCSLPYRKEDVDGYLSTHDLWFGRKP
ncbi:hypothetical protein F5X99DRAFT_406762 [Biscogniauxia marginata]|nr:hypothetical protein F5X99DRAFT_406762 [Biscogniauxia marginata]